MTLTGKEISRWADSAMFKAEPIADQSGPKVYLLEMTHDPLGSAVALNAMYTGNVIRSKNEVTDEQRASMFSDMQKTALKTPLEAIKLHFLFEGVTRAFTHQLVRNRTSAFAQESMRFAVKEDMPIGLPPSLQGSEPFGGGIMSKYDYDRASDLDKMRFKWDDTVEVISHAYNDLVNMGMPAEDARGLAPTNVLTRINMVTDLRTLIDVLGDRLCTQAQFEWRLVAAEIAKAIRERYKQDVRWMMLSEVGDDSPDHTKKDWLKRIKAVEDEYAAIAGLFKPICYHTGKCEFMASIDRECSIRNRVQANHDVGRPSREWGEEYDQVVGNPIVAGVGPRSVMREDGPADGDDDVPTGKPVFIGAIQPAEWLLDPAAAR